MTQDSQATLNAVISATRAYQSALGMKATVRPPVQAAEPTAEKAHAPDADALARAVAPAVSRLIGREIRERGSFP